MSAGGAPTYSIVIPVFERLLGFRDALAAACAVGGCSEILVVDDCSSHDGFEQVCRDVADARVRYLRNEVNQGIFGNWNLGVSAARGDFVSILCSDDLVAPDAYDRLLGALDLDPDLDVVFGPFCTFTDSVDDAREVRSFEAGPVRVADFLADVARRGPGFPVLTIARRTTLLSRPFVAQPHSGNDWLWIYCNAGDLRLVATATPFSFWRRHPDQDASRRQSVTTDCWPLMYQQISHHLHRLGRHADARRARRRGLGLVLSWLLNDRGQPGGHRSRLLSGEVASNVFMAHASALVQGDALLRALLYGRWPSGADRLLGRAVRRSRWYPGL